MDMFLILNAACIPQAGEACCGTMLIPAQIVSVIQVIINLIRFGVPILLIIFGMLDLGKSVMAQKEDEIKKGQQLFVKRLISAAIVFFVVTIVQFFVNILDNNPTYVRGNESRTQAEFNSLPDRDKDGWVKQSGCINAILNAK